MTKNNATTRRARHIIHRTRHVTARTSLSHRAAVAPQSPRGGPASLSALHRRLAVRTTRMEAFSDGVFAIAITLLVLDLAVPNLADYAVVDGLVKQWPAYLAYVVSFAAIGGAWISHTTITEYLESADALLLRLNLLLLFFVSIMPFPTHMLVTYGLRSDAERLAVTLYGLNLLSISAITSLLWRYAVVEQFIKGDTTEDAVRGVTAKLHPSIALYGATVVVGLLVPVVAVVLYLAIAFFLLIPFRALHRRLRRRPGGG